MNSIIRAKNIYLRYTSTGETVLKDISFDLLRGEIAAILGPSGAGKTSFLNIVSQLLNKKEAEINGALELAGGNPKIRTVFQMPTLLPWRTVKRNITFGLEAEKIPREEIEEKARKSAQLVGLKGFENYFPHQLSVGMRQRVNFARALVCEPDILLLDEPFSALDLETKARIQKEFLKILREKNITVIFVTHSMAEASFMADKIILFSEKPAYVKAIMSNNQLKRPPEDTAAYFDLLEE